MVIWLIFFYFTFLSLCVEVDLSEDVADPLIWKTKGLTLHRYEKVNLEEESFLAVCLATEFSGLSGVDGKIALKDQSGNTRYVFYTSSVNVSPQHSQHPALTWSLL
jgi:hypothetical protein